MIASSLDYLKWRCGNAWSIGPTSGSLNTSGDHRHSLSPQSSGCLTVWSYQSSFMAVTPGLLTRLIIRWINSSATSAYQIMTGVTWLGEVHNTTVLASVSCQHLIHTFQTRQLKFLGQSENSTYALYQPLHGNTVQGDLAPTSSITSASWQDVARLNCWSWHRTGGMTGENLWSSDLTHSHLRENCSNQIDKWLNVWLIHFQLVAQNLSQYFVWFSMWIVLYWPSDRTAEVCCIGHW